MYLVSESFDERFDGSESLEEGRPGIRFLDFSKRVPERLLDVARARIIRGSSTSARFAVLRSELHIDPSLLRLMYLCGAASVTGSPRQATIDSAEGLVRTNRHSLPSGSPVRQP